VTEGRRQRRVVTTPEADEDATRIDRWWVQNRGAALGQHGIEDRRLRRDEALEVEGIVGGHLSSLHVVGCRGGRLHGKRPG
jgi:hypothetical protein